jgi:hypothetical protein
MLGYWLDWSVCVEGSTADVGSSIEVLMLKRVVYLTEYPSNDGLRAKLRRYMPGNILQNRNGSLH